MVNLPTQENNIYIIFFSTGSALQFSNCLHVIDS